MEDESYLMHYGKGHLDGGHSGRYEWGSGDDPYQRYSTFLETVHELKRQGVTEANIAKSYNMSTTQLRAQVSIAKDAKRAADAAQAYNLYSQGKTASEIGRIMGRNESSIRALLDPAIKKNTDTTKNTADVLKEAVDQKGIIDIGIGSELYVGVSRTKLMTAVEMLKEQGYVTNQVQVDQLGTAGNQKTYVLTLCPPGTTYKDVVSNLDKIQMVTDVHTDDDGLSFQGLKPIQSVSSDRVFIKYGDEGGKEKDGVIELRRGVEDISLGDSNYAQVRIAVDGTHYLKGMAMYSDKIPEGYDIVFNTNKNSDKTKLEVMKPLKDNPDNPFGATIKAGGQREYIDPETGEKKISCINIVNEEGDWDEWSRTLSSQMLSKQSPSLAKKQLDLDYNIRKAEYDDIMTVDNPTVKKKLLEDFAENCDAASVHLKAAALPRQAAHVLLPVDDMDPNEIYAPKYQNGEKVVLIRFPHGGTFEIPELTVNNNQKTAKKNIGQALDAVGINAKVAEKLSGADFDGDTALVIPNNDGKIKTSVLKQLQDFDPKDAYPGYPGMKVMSSKTKQTEMGKVSNLITDMTIKGASADEIARAVKHSMVVIDAEKHKLNYEQSYIDNDIAALKAKYQGGERKGASTLISQASSTIRVAERKAGQQIVDPETGKIRRVYIDPKTGKKLYEETNRTYNDYKKDPKTGEYILKKENVKALSEVTKMEQTDDAFTLSSGTVMESVYANYANNLKALANESRKKSLEVEAIKYSPSAAKEYAQEVKSLKGKLYEAQKNAPLERQAQLLANAKLNNKKKDNPDMDKAEIKKLKGQLLAACRLKVGAKKQRVTFTEKEWEAVQKGAISNSLLTSLLNNSDMDSVKKLATPRNSRGMSDSKIRQAKLMLNRGYTQAEIAASLGVSASTINSIAKGEN